RAEECFYKIKELDYEYLTHHFKLIREMPVIPIIVLPKFQGHKDPDIKKARELIKKLKEQKAKSLPRKLYRFMTDIYDYAAKNIERLSHKNGKGLKNPNRPFEKIDIRGVRFYVLDLEYPGAEKYYDDFIGLKI
ncbi:MAG: hypothetical protein ACP6IY_22715, partial [Promethearchaeia archaeon]